MVIVSQVLGVYVWHIIIVSDSSYVLDVFVSLKFYFLEPDIMVHRQFEMTEAPVHENARWTVLSPKSTENFARCLASGWPLMEAGNQEVMLMEAGLQCGRKWVFTADRGIEKGLGPWQLKPKHKPVQRQCSGYMFSPEPIIVRRIVATVLVAAATMNAAGGMEITLSSPFGGQVVSTMSYSRPRMSVRHFLKQVADEQGCNELRLIVGGEHIQPAARLTIKRMFGFMKEHALI